jgi:hypothetical protein
LATLFERTDIFVSIAFNADKALLAAEIILIPPFKD